MYAFDGHGNVGIEQRSFRVVPPTVPGTNIAQGRPATASSYQPTGTNGPQLPSYAVDGNYGTRWASEWVDTAWLQVDLGSVQSFNHVLLGLGGGVRQGVHSAGLQRRRPTGRRSTRRPPATAGSTDLTVTGSGRYVRVNGTDRATAYGYSLWEFGVYRS